MLLSASILWSSILFCFYLKIYFFLKNWIWLVFKTQGTSIYCRGSWVSWLQKWQSWGWKRVSFLPPGTCHQSHKERLPFTAFKNNAHIHILYENRKGRYLNSSLIRHFFPRMISHSLAAKNVQSDISSSHGLILCCTKQIRSAFGS